MIEHKLSAIPIVDQKDNFLGFIQKNDIILIIKDDRYELVRICLFFSFFFCHFIPIFQLSVSNGDFLLYVKQIKDQFKALSYEGNKFFSPNDTLKLVVEKILFAPGNRLVSINENTNKICGIITLTDLFNFYLKSV